MEERFFAAGLSGETDMAADTTYENVVQIRQDGNLHVPSGCAADVEAGGSLTFGDVPFTHRTVKVALAAVDTGGGIFAWQNPEAGPIIVTKVILRVTTIATGACTVDVGTTATNATTVSDNLLDGIDVHTATGLFGLADGADTNGKAQQELAAGKWITGSKASGASAGLVGSAFITYTVI